MENPVLENIKFVVENSKKVKINEKSLEYFCSDFKVSESIHWLDAIPFKIQKLEQKEELILLLINASLCFCFWGEPKWAIEYKGKLIDGAWGLFVSLIKALEHGFPILDLEYLKEIPENDLRKIFEGNTEIPLFKERVDILRENGKILIEKFNGNPENLIKEGKEDTMLLLGEITSNFPCFDDFAIYQEKNIFFHKKAQLFISDIYQRIGVEKLGDFKNMEKLTALADYKIPKVLRRFGILEYSKDLAQKVDNKILIPQGSEEEIEIRASMVWAVELMKSYLKSRFPNINSRQIDSYLWLKGKEKTSEDKPYHLTKTIFY